MPEGGYFLTEADLSLLRELAESHRQKVHNAQNRPFVDEEDPFTPEVYIALTPKGGIPALVGLTPGFADCQIYRILQDSLSIAPGAVYRRVYNLTTSAIAGNTIIQTKRDKYGTWLAEAPGGGSTAFSGARVWNSANLSISSALGELALTFDSTRFDTDSYHTAGSSRFTALVAGYYWIGGSVRFKAGAVYEVFTTGLTVRLNGIAGNYISYVEDISQDSKAAGTSYAEDSEMNINTLWKMNAGDYVELTAYHTRTTAAIVQSQPIGEQASPEFWIVKLG